LSSKRTAPGLNVWRDSHQEPSRGEIMGFSLYLVKGEGAFTFIFPHSVLATFLLFPILNILVPHVGHVPCVAGFPFFMVMLLGFLIFFLARHFIQYACIVHPPFTANLAITTNYFILIVPL
jgi:hypothetical protein